MINRHAGRNTRQCLQAERYYQKLFTLSSDSAQLLKYNAGDIEKWCKRLKQLIIREYLKQLDSSKVYVSPSRALFRTDILLVKLYETFR